MKIDGHFGRDFLKGAADDAAKVILGAAGHNLHPVRAWLKILLRLLLIAIGSLFTILTAQQVLLESHPHLTRRSTLLT